MKMQFFSAILVVMCLTVHCKSVRYTNGKLRNNRSPVNDGQFNEFEQQQLEGNNGFLQDPQFNAQPGTGNEYGYIPQETPVYNDGSFQPAPLDQNAPVEPEQTAQDNVAQLPDTPVQDNEPQSDEEDDEDETDIAKSGNNGPSINFFPVMFGSGRGRSGGMPGTVAVANSFSTGRRGVATSNANAFASPVGQYRN